MMKIKINKLVLSAWMVAGAFSFGACETFGDPRKSPENARARLEVLPKGIAQWELPAELREVSAIALLEDNLMACVQDEEGTIYLFDLKQKAVKDKIAFAGPGDYEGIAINGNTAYILRSDGAIFEVADFRGSKPVITEHKSVLTSTQNTEGLAFDEKNNRLLIACKGYDERLGDAKGIYAFSLNDKKMQESPAITIPLAQEQLTQKGKKRKDKYDALQPSSLDVHPETGELYLLDAENKRLLTIDDKGSVRKAVDLDEKQLRQAEGLSFGSNGEMYIASEGSKKGKGIIVKYGKGI